MKERDAKRAPWILRPSLSICEQARAELIVWSDKQKVLFVRPLPIRESPRACVTSARDWRCDKKESPMRWRFAVAGLLCIGAGPDPGAMLPFELGVLSCTLGHAIDPQMSDQTAAASEAREMLCLFTPARNGPDEAYAGALRSINAGKMLPDNVALLWKVR